MYNAKAQMQQVAGQHIWSQIGTSRNPGLRYSMEQSYIKRPTTSQKKINIDDIN